MSASRLPRTLPPVPLRKHKPLLLMALFLSTSALAGCRSEADEKHAQASPTPPQPVQVLSVKLESAGHSWSYTGTVQPRYEAGLGFRVGGKILERRVDAGQVVKAGEVIARLDSTDFELSLAAQQAELSAAKASHDDAQAALSRYRTLFGQGHVSKAALDQRSSAAAEAVGRVERALRALDLARNQLAYTVLKADQAGVVTSLAIETGQVVSAGQLVAKVARQDAIEVETAIPEQQIEEIRTAQAEVDVWPATDKPLRAELRELSPQADPASRTYRARFALPGVTDLPLGRTATVKLKAGARGDVAALPLSAVMNDGTGTKVWVLSANKTRALPVAVEVGAVEQDRVLVKSGLSNGDLVVTLGVHMLDPDKPVRLIEQRAAVNKH